LAVGDDALKLLKMCADLVELFVVEIVRDEVVASSRISVAAVIRRSSFVTWSRSYGLRLDGNAPAALLRHAETLTATNVERVSSR